MALLFGASPHLPCIAGLAHSVTRYVGVDTITLMPHVLFSSMAMGVLIDAVGHLIHCVEAGGVGLIALVRSGCSSSLRPRESGWSCR